MTRTKTPRKRPGVRPGGRARKRAQRTHDRKPPNWDRWILAAHHIRHGDSQTDAAAKIGIRRETLNRWMADAKWWPTAVAEEMARYRSDWDNRMEIASRKTLEKSAERGNVQVAQWFLERKDEGLAPKSKHEHSGPKGGPIQTKATVHVYMPDNGRGDGGA